MSDQNAFKASGRPTSAQVAVVCDKHGADASRLGSFLQTRGWSEARWYAVRDLDDVDAAAGAANVGTVVFVSWQDLLEGIWNGEVSYDRWLAAGVRVEFVESAGDSACLATVAAAWAAYRKTQKRRHAVAGLILSIIVLIAAFVIILGR